MDVRLQIQITEEKERKKREEKGGISSFPLSSP